MGSQQDLDQGGTSREWVATYMGPSVGWVWLPNRNVLSIKIAGTYVLNLSTTLVEVNVDGAVVVMLPTAIDPDVPAIAQPQSYAKRPVTIVDIGGFASANPITIEPASVAENIMALASISISVNYGGYTLTPSSTLKGWTTISP